MSDNKEEVKIEEVPIDVQPVQVSIEEEAVEAGYSDLELKALGMGWIPPEEFKGPEDEFVSAKEYIARGSFFKKIERQNAQIAELKTIIDTMSQTLSVKEKAEQDRMLKYIEQQKSLAKQNLDMDTYEQLVTHEKELLTQPKIQQPIRQQQVNPLETLEGQEFVKNNTWLQRTDDVAEKMKIHSTMLAQKIARENPALGLGDTLNYIHKEIRKEYPNEFRAKGTSQVVTSKLSGGSSKDAGDEFSNLNAAERQVAEYLKANKQDYKSYIKNLKK